MLPASSQPGGMQGRQRRHVVREQRTPARRSNSQLLVVRGAQQPLSDCGARVEPPEAKSFGNRWVEFSSRWNLTTLKPPVDRGAA